MLTVTILAGLVAGGSALGLWESPPPLPEATPSYRPMAETPITPVERPDPPKQSEQPSSQAMAYNGHVYEELPLPGVRITDQPVTTGPAQPSPAAQPMPAAPAAPTPQPVPQQASLSSPKSPPAPPAKPAHSAAPPPIPKAVPAVAPTTPLGSASTEQQVAGLPSPAWLRNALPIPSHQGKAMIAIVIDDMGVDVKRSAKISDLPGPLTTSFLTYARNLQEQADHARAKGHELMVHFPMEPKSTSIDPGPDVLRTGLPPDEIERRLTRGLSSFKGYVGINNHMGSKFTEYAPGMEQVMKALKARGLLWLDSRTTSKSVGIDLAAKWGVPHADRHVFLDNDESVSSVNRQLAEVERIALHHGFAIAIGHPRDQTIEALRQWLPSLNKKGLILVPISTIIRTHAAQTG